VCREQQRTAEFLSGRSNLFDGVVAVHRVTITIREGQNVRSVIGPNGAGKNILT
jgi:ABC-type branched-subunit amino acid transport system ATPase component